MSDELEAVLRLVAEGRLTPEEAAPIVAALQGRQAPPPPSTAMAPVANRAPGSARQLRIRVEERGRTVVNLRVPVAVASAAIDLVPGLSGDYAARVQTALAGGVVGPIIDIEDPDGDAVLISLE